MFFEAVECEELFKFLQVEAPKDEVEYIIKNAPKEEVRIDWLLFILMFCLVYELTILIIIDLIMRLAQYLNRNLGKNALRSIDIAYPQ